MRQFNLLYFCLWSKYFYLIMFIMNPVELFLVNVDWVERLLKCWRYWTKYRKWMWYDLVKCSAILVMEALFINFVDLIICTEYYAYPSSSKLSNVCRNLPKFCCFRQIPQCKIKFIIWRGICRGKERSMHKYWKII